MPEEKFPVHESIKVLEGITIDKSSKWWSAIILSENRGRKQIATYLWTKRNDVWKRKQKFVVRNIKDWNKIKEAVEKLLPKLEKT